MAKAGHVFNEWIKRNTLQLEALAPWCFGEGGGVILNGWGREMKMKQQFWDGGIVPLGRMRSGNTHSNQKASIKQTATWLAG